MQFSNYLVSLQHDENYEMMSNPVYTQNLTQPEDFFIRKFDDNPNITSIQLRMEEEDLESKLFSLRDHENEHRIQNFTRFRDYLTLCRGGTLVSIKISMISTTIIDLIWNCIMFDISFAFML